MTMSDPLGDMLTRIRNGQRVRKLQVQSPDSVLRRAVLDVLKQQGYIRGYEKKERYHRVHELVIDLKYTSLGPVIHRIKRVSRPGRRVYCSARFLPRVDNGLGIAIISTSRGVLADSEARAMHIGGEVLAEVF